VGAVTQVSFLEQFFQKEKVIHVTASLDNECMKQNKNHLLYSVLVNLIIN